MGKCLCIEAGADAVVVSCVEKDIHRRVTVKEMEKIPLLAGTFGDAQAMADCLREQSTVLGVKRLPVVIMANTRRTALRFADITGAYGRLSDHDAPSLLRQSFPFGESFNENTHVTSYTVLQGKCLFMAALPVSVAESLAGMCVALSVNIHRVKRIDTAEHALAQFYGALYKEPFWLCLPQDGALRVLAFLDGVPHAAYGVSNNPLYREAELTRLWRIGQTPHAPERVVLPPLEDEYAWLSRYIKNTLSTPVTESFEVEGGDFHHVAARSVFPCEK